MAWWGQIGADDPVNGGMMARIQRLAVAAAVLTALLAPSVAVAHAAARAPRPGECYLLTSVVLESLTWPSSAAPVPCSRPHTFELTRTGSLAKDVNARYYAQQQCPDEGLWSDVGVNQPIDGIVDNPVRVEGYWFVVDDESFACGVAARAFHGRKPATSEPMSGRIGDLSDAQLAALRFCSKATKGRDVAKPPITVDCARTPRWEAVRWVDWTQFYADFPGTATLRAKARELCPAGARISYPDEERWAHGSPRTWCYLRIGV